MSGAAGFPRSELRAAGSLGPAVSRANASLWLVGSSPIRTIALLDLDFSVFTREAFRFQATQEEANGTRRLGMSLRAIGAALVDEKTVRKALAGLAS
jgi:hypothetical protein